MVSFSTSGGLHSARNHRQVSAGRALLVALPTALCGHAGARRLSDPKDVLAGLEDVRRQWRPSLVGWRPWLSIASRVEAIALRLQAISSEPSIITSEDTRSDAPG